MRASSHAPRWNQSVTCMQDAISTIVAHEAIMDDALEFGQKKWDSSDSQVTTQPTIKIICRIIDKT